ncbi:glycoside hydrolase family 3 protein [Chryseobacterium sp. A301]
MKPARLYSTLLLSIFISSFLSAQYKPLDLTEATKKEAEEWVNKTYESLSQDEKIGQLFIVALYTNKGEQEIEHVKALVKTEKLGGLILMQDDAKREIEILNELQSQSKVAMLVGMDAEWGIYQRIAKAYKLPWAMALGAITDKTVITEMASQIASDAKRMGVNWVFAPVVDVNTNPSNPIIGNRSFGSEVDNVVLSANAYTKGLQDHGVLAAIKHFPGHGDTSMDSHLDLPVVAHSKERLEKIELAPFKAMMDLGVGGVMVAHLYVPALEPKKGVPASISSSVITGLLKDTYGYEGLIITDALNMGAVAKRYKPGELDFLAFQAGNDIMLFSQEVHEGKKRIREGLENGTIPESRLEESVKKILKTKYYLGLDSFEPISTQNLDYDLNNQTHKQMAQKVYSKALTLLRNENAILPLTCKETYYYIGLEEAPFHEFVKALQIGTTVIAVSKSKISTIPKGAKVIVGLHKDNSTAYKPYKISKESKDILKNLTKDHEVILSVFASPYALLDMDLQGISGVVVAYENNIDSQMASAKAFLGQSPMEGKLPVSISADLKAGDGLILPTQETSTNPKPTSQILIE